LRFLVYRSFIKKYACFLVIVFLQFQNSSGDDTKSKTQPVKFDIMHF